MPTATAPLSSAAIIAELGYTPASNAAVVHLTGNETIAGEKTFTGSVEIEKADLEQVITPGVSLVNPTLATALETKQYSPSLLFQSSGWVAGSEITQYAALFLNPSTDEDKSVLTFAYGSDPGDLSTVYEFDSLGNVFFDAILSNGITSDIYNLGEGSGVALENQGVDGALFSQSETADDFSIYFNGLTAGHTQIKRVGAELHFKLADDSAFADVRFSIVKAGVWQGTAIADGFIASAAAWNAKENSANKATSFSVVNDTLFPTVAAVKAYADALVVGLLDDRGNFDASGNVFPSSDGSGTAGAILKGDLYFISVGGTLGGTAVAVGDQVRALVDTPGQTAGNWAIAEANIGFVPENVANKATAFGTLNNTLYPTTQAVANYAQPLDSDLTIVATIGTANQQIRVNAGGTALEYFTPTGGGTTINATNGVLPYRSDANTFLDSPFSVSNNRVVVTPAVATSGVQPYYRLITPADTGQTLSTEFPGMVFGGNASGATVIRSGADGVTIAVQREAVFIAPTYAFGGATTITNAATLAVNAAPIVGANATITNAWAFWVQAGRALFSGGITAPGAGAQSEAFGLSASSGGAFATALGPSAAAGGDQSIAIGFSAVINGADTGAIAIGASAIISASCGGAIAIGKDSGGSVGTTGANSISIGIRSCAFTANTMVVGSDTQPINVFFGGKGERHATPVVFTVSGTHGLGANIAGADLALQAGLGTGSGDGGAIIFKGALPTGSSSTRNTAEEWARISSIGVLAFPATMTAPGTTGARTIDKVSGSVNFAASATSLVVTCNKAKANSIIIPIVATNDATMKSCAYTVTDGSFTLFPDAAPTGETKVTFLVLNL